MADPVSAVIMIAGAALGGVSAFRNTQAANAQAEGQANTERMNAQIMQQNAANEAVNRENALRTSRQKYNILSGQDRAQAGALGMFGGSSLDVLADINNQGVFEQRSIVSSSTNQQQNYLNQAASYKARASNLLSSRQSPWLNAGLAMAGSALGSMSSANSGSQPSQTSNVAGGSFNYNTGTSTAEGFA